MRLLIANPFGIGDVLFTLPFVQAVRKHSADGYLAFLCNQRTESLVRCWPEINRTFVFEKDALRQALRRSKRSAIQMLAALLAALRDDRFEVLVDLSLGWHYGLAGILAGIPKRVGFNTKNRGKFLTNSIPLSSFALKPVAEYVLDLLSLLDLPRPAQTRIRMPLSPQTSELARRRLATLSVDPRRRLVGLVPGGGASWGPNARFKQWGSQSFAALARALIECHQAQILIFGDSGEEDLCHQIAQAAPKGLALAIPPGPLDMLAGMLQHCSLAVGNDSGPMHLAEAIGTPTVSIFGPVDASVYGPMGESTRHRVVTRGLVCQPCYQGFRFPPCPWDNACLKGLEVGQVLKAVEDLLNGRTGQHANALTR